MAVLVLGTLLDVLSDWPDNDAESIPPEGEMPDMPQAMNREIAVTVPLPPERLWLQAPPLASGLLGP